MNVVVSHWSANAVVLAAYAVAAAAHLLGVRGAAAASRRGDAPPPGQVREAVAFQGGLLAAALALVSPLGYWSHIYIWVRSVQDLLLAQVAPGLMVLGAPWEALARSLAPARRMLPWRGSRSRLTARAADADPLDQPARERPERSWCTVPVAVTVAYSLIWWGWHLPVLYDAAARQSAVAAAEVIMYVGGGILLWRQLIGSRPHSPAFSPIYRFMLLGATGVSGTVLAMILTFGSGLFYPGYRSPHRSLLSVVADQQIGGATLWVLALPALFTAGVALLIGWLNDEEATEVSRGLDRMLRPPGQAWPSRPGFR